MGLFTGTQNAYYDGADNLPNTGDESYGGYQFISLSDVIDNFVATYIGEGKILEKTNRADVSFHAHRALAELSFDTFKSCKSQEIEVPPSLTMPMPHDYVNYVKFTWSDASGIEHIIYPTKHTSNSFPIQQDDSGNYNISGQGNVGEPGDDSITFYEQGHLLQDLQKGMYAYGPNIPEGATVQYTLQVLGGPNPTIEVVLQDDTGAQIIFPSPWENQVYFSDLDESILIQEKSAVRTFAKWLTGKNWLSVSDVSGLEVGMKVSGVGAFPAGTYIVDINTSSTNTLNTVNPGYPVVTVSNMSNNTQTTSTVSVDFVSYEKISDTWDKYKAVSPSENINQDYKNSDNRFFNQGQRYGLHPEHSQTNGSFFIDCETGKIHFSSNLAGRTIILEYVSDSLGTDGEMQVHKFAEEAIYKWIAYGCLIARIGIPEYVINRFKKEKIAETRKAKLRLSNIKLEEITQILRNKSKWIKH